MGSYAGGQCKGAACFEVEASILLYILSRGVWDTLLPGKLHSCMVSIISLSDQSWMKREVYIWLDRGRKVRHEA